MEHSFEVFGATYDCGSYGAGTFDNGSCSTSSTSGGTSSGSLLTNTGFDIALAVTVACVIIFAALVIRFWKRPPKVNQTQTEE